MAEKARFYLEQAIPELQDLERKKIFTKEEIQSISRKRSHYEHRIAAPRCKPADFLAYATYEINLEALRLKRVKRLKIRVQSSMAHLGSRRILFILQRATRKFHGDVQLWKTYAEYCRSRRSYGLLRKVLDSMLRLHPTNADLWIYAARIAIDDNSNMFEARGYLQRGLRFCRRSQSLWAEYAKFECIFISKLASRLIALGAQDEISLRGLEDGPGSLEENETFEDDEDEMRENLSVMSEDDEIKLPSLEQDGTEGSSTHEALGQQVTSTAHDDVLNGVIPTIVFDEAMAAVPADPLFAVAFFDIFERFTELRCQHQILSHVSSHLLTTYPSRSEALLCHVREPIVGIATTDPKFPSALRTAFKRFIVARGAASDKVELLCGFRDILLNLVSTGNEPIVELDESLRTAVEMFLGRLVQWAADDGIVLPPRNMERGMPTVTAIPV